MLEQAPERAGLQCPAALDALERKAAFSRTLRHAGALIAQAALLGFLLLAFFIRVPQVSGHSMEPQIQAGDHVLINMLAYRFHQVARGDVIAFAHVVDDQKQTYLKRVVGLPGDTVAIDHGKAIVDGLALADRFGLFTSDGASMAPQVVPAGELFVLGDNRGDSDDSREFGAVPEDALIGQAALLVWPLNRVRAVR